LRSQVEEIQKAFVDIEEDYLHGIRDTRYQTLKGTKAGDHVRECFANPDRDCAFVEDLADLLGWCGASEAYPALWNLVEDQKASLKHIKDHERERIGYKQMTVILQEVKISSIRPAAPGLGKTLSNP